MSPATAASRQRRAGARHHHQRAAADLRPGQGPRCRTRRIAAADRPRLVAAGGRPLHHEARPPVDPRQAAHLHARHDRLLRLAGSLSRSRRRFHGHRRHGHRRSSTGPANNPKFAFSSVPGAAGGRGLGAARLRSLDVQPLAIQIAQLAEAAAQFAGVGGKTSLLDTLRGKHRRRRSRHQDQPTAERAVSAGKYLNDRTYLTIEKGDKAGSGKAAIDLNIGRGVKLRGEATDERRGQGRHLLRARILSRWPAGLSTAPLALCAATAGAPCFAGGSIKADDARGMPNLRALPILRIRLSLFARTALQPKLHILSWVPHPFRFDNADGMRNGNRQKANNGSCL